MGWCICKVQRDKTVYSGKWVCFSRLEIDLLAGCESQVWKQSWVWLVTVTKDIPQVIPMLVR